MQQAFCINKSQRIFMKINTLGKISVPGIPGMFAWQKTLTLLNSARKQELELLPGCH